MKLETGTSATPERLVRTATLGMEVFAHNWPLYLEIASDPRFDVSAAFRLASLFLYKDFNNDNIAQYWQAYLKGNEATPSLIMSYLMHELLEAKRFKIRPPGGRFQTTADYATLFMNALIKRQSLQHVVEQLNQEESEFGYVFEDMGELFAEGDPIGQSVELDTSEKDFNELHLRHLSLNHVSLLAQAQVDIRHIRRNGWRNLPEKRRQLPILMVSWLIHNSDSSRARLRTAGVQVDRANAFYFDPNKLLSSRDYALSFNPYPTTVPNILRVALMNTRYSPGVLESFVFNEQLPKVGALVLPAEDFFIFDNTTGPGPSGRSH